MLSRPDDPYRGLKRTFRVALIVSLLIHPLLLALFGLQFHLRHQDIAAQRKRDPSEIVTVSSSNRHAKRTVAAREPQPHEAVRPQPRRPRVVAHTQRIPRPVEVARPVSRPVARPIPVRTLPPPIPLKQELAKVAPGTPVPVAVTAPPHKARPVKEAAQTVAEVQQPDVTQRQVRPHRSTYSDAQIAQIESDLTKSIRGTRGSENPLSNVNNKTVAEAPRHYGMDFRAASGGARGAQGICDPVTSWQQGGYDYYYLACNVLEGDGSTTRKALPWPVRFKPDIDPFNGDWRGGDPGEIALPLPGWHPPAGKSIDPDFVGYLRQRGYPI